MHYSHQNEYRFIWANNGDITGTTEIECPEAIQFCKRK